MPEPELDESLELDELELDESLELDELDELELDERWPELGELMSSQVLDLGCKLAPRRLPVLSGIGTPVAMPMMKPVDSSSVWCFRGRSGARAAR